MPALNHPSSRGSHWFWRLVVLGILAAGVGGYVALQVLRPKPAVRAPAKQLPLVRVAPLELREGALLVTGNGLVKPRNEVVLAAELSGRIAYVSPALVTGGAFARGEVLVRLDPAPFEAALAQTEADRRAARASLALAEAVLKRTEELIAQGFLSRQTLDDRTAARDQALAVLARTEAVEQQRRIDLERSVIRAPFRGRVLSERVDPGETVQPGKELARLFADDALEIAVSLTDRDVALIADPWATGAVARRAAAAASVIVEHGGQRYRWPARLERVEAAVDSATRTFNAVVRVDHPGTPGKPQGGTAEAAAPPLLVGMYATVEIAGRDLGRYARVPRSALRDGGVLWLVDREDKVSVQPVRLLREEKDHAVLAAEGLTAGARVIVSDLKVVTPGMPVRVAGEATRSTDPAAARTP